MEPLTAENAAQALAAAWAADEAAAQGEPAPEPVAAPSEGHQQEQSNQSDQSGLFYGVDPNELSPENRKVFDEMQAAWTQKTQALAAERKEWESLGSPDQVKQAVEWVNSLSDPQNLVQLHQELSDYLQQSGYTKADADAAATSAIQEQQAETEDYGFSDPEVNALKQELKALQDWRANFEQEQEEARLRAVLEKTEIQLRQERSYDDIDIGRIQQLAWAHGADLRAAADAYDSMRNDIIASYVNAKAEAPQPATAPIVSSQFGQRPETFGSDFEAAHRFAKNKVLAMQREGYFDGE